MLIISGSGFRLYFTPTVSIHIEINPSVGLELNRFDRVISVDGYNEDGERLTASLDLKYLDYVEALNQILEDEDIVRLLSENRIMTISVTGDDEDQCTRVLSNVQSCTENRGDIHCYSENGHGGRHRYEAESDYEPGQPTDTDASSGHHREGHGRHGHTQGHE